MTMPIIWSLLKLHELIRLFFTANATKEQIFDGLFTHAHGVLQLEAQISEVFSSFRAVPVSLPDHIGQFLHEIETNEADLRLVEATFPDEFEGFIDAIGLDENPQLEIRRQIRFEVIDEIEGEGVMAAFGS